jgi:hypothetical protein
MPRRATVLVEAELRAIEARQHVCAGFAPGTTVEAGRASRVCRPYRCREPSFLAADRPSVTRQTGQAGGSLCSVVGALGPDRRRWSEMPQGRERAGGPLGPAIARVGGGNVLRRQGSHHGKT